MKISSLAIKRRQVLGELYNHCDSIESIPVYLDEKSAEPLGYVDESLGNYVDAFLFHLSEDICKKLSASYYVYAFDYDLVVAENTVKPKKRIKLNHILLISRKAPEKKMPVKLIS